MAKRLGRNWDVAIDDTGSAYVEIGNIKSSDVNIENDKIDATDNDSAGFNEGEYGQTQFTVNATMNYDKADAAQLELQAAAEAKTKKFFRVRPTSTSGEREMSAQCIITSYNITGDTTSIAEVSFTAESDGVVTYADQ